MRVTLTAVHVYVYHVDDFKCILWNNSFSGKLIILITLQYKKKTVKGQRKMLLICVMCLNLIYHGNRKVVPCLNNCFVTFWLVCYEKGKAHVSDQELFV